MNFRTSDGVELFYELEGEGFPIVFLNGMWGDTTTWAKCIPHFSRIFTCLRLDHRGIGNSEKWNGNYSYDLHANDVIELLNHLNIDHTHIVGTCHGGMVAAAAAKNHPERVVSLAINGTQLLKSKRNAAVFLGWKSILETAGFEVLYRSVIIPSIFSEKFIKDNENRLEDIVTATVSRIKHDAAIGMVEAAATFGFTHEEISSIKVPALLMSGEEDVFSPPFTIEEYVGYWKDSEYYMFPGCAHFPQREALEAYIAVVKEYLIRKTLELS